MSKLIDLAGKRIGRLTAIRPAPDKKGYLRYWCCRCDCGSECVVFGGALRGTKKLTLSCGCLARELSASRAANMRAAKRVPAGAVAERKRAYRKANRDLVRQHKRQWSKRSVDVIADRYVRQLLRVSGMRSSDIPSPIIELKREQLRLRRLTKEMQQAINERKELEHES